MAYTARLFEYVGPEMPFFRRAVLANLWLFGPLVERRLSRSPQLNAGIRTTTAATLFSGGVKDNILPIRARSIVNFRIMPDESVESVIDYVQATIDNPEIQIHPVGYHGDPSPVSDIQSPSYKILQRTIYEAAAEEELIVAPYLVVGATDSRYFTALSSNIYRFLLNKLGPEDIKRIHGTNERIVIENYLKVVLFYYQLLRNSNEL
jgi:carboxypeptidase PM20D1